MLQFDLFQDHRGVKKIEIVHCISQHVHCYVMKSILCTIIICTETRYSTLKKHFDGYLTEIIDV